MGPLKTFLPHRTEEGTTSRQNMHFFKSFLPFYSCHSCHYYLPYLPFALPVIPPDSSDEELEGGDSSEDEEDDIRLQKALATSIGDVGPPIALPLLMACLPCACDGAGGE